MQRCIRVLFFLSPVFLLIAFGSHGSAQNGYAPAPVFCANGGTSLCSVIPGNIGDDPALNKGFGYQGLIGRNPTSADNDVQTPFDNLSWQTFVALNWAAKSVSAPPEQGLQSAGARVWQTWARPGDVFKGPSKHADCTLIGDESVFSFDSNGQGKEVAQHEEIIQAATGDPLIDIDGNWTVYERRLNTIEISYLQAPGGNKQWNLTTAAGQKAFLAAKPPQKVNFPDFNASKTTGAIEIKAAWRILDLKKHPDDAKRFYVIHALLAVAPDLVKPAGKICAQVDLGLVAMHIIQKNAPRATTCCPAGSGRRSSMSITRLRPQRHATSRTRLSATSVRSRAILNSNPARHRRRLRVRPNIHTSTKAFRLEPSTHRPRRRQAVNFSGLENNPLQLTI